MAHSVHGQEMNIAGRSKARLKTVHRKVSRFSFRTAIARATGRRHESAGVECQDAVAQKIGHSFGAIALADGAGTAKYSADGAQAVTTKVIEFLSANISELLACADVTAATQIIDVLLQELESKSVQLNCRTSELASTLLFFATDGKAYFAGQVGDGRIAVRNSNTKKWEPLLESQKGEFFNETTFVTSAGVHSSIQMARGDVSSVSACILMSDGAEESLYQRSTGVFAVAVESIASWLVESSRQSVEATLDKSLRNVMRTKTTDDLSLALLVNLGAF